MIALLNILSGFARARPTKRNGKFFRNHVDLVEVSR